MTGGAPRNMAASVRQRIRNAAEASGQRFEELLQHYALERFLYRLSVSDHAGAFILKGALLLRVWGISSIRSTRDIDLLGRIANNADELVRIVRELCLTEVESDGLVFDPDSVRSERIAEEAEYEGVRVLFDGRLGTARIRMQIDIGFGDQVTPAPVDIEYPSTLGMERPRLRAYTAETSIAEKLHVMLQREMLNSRMKDYFDIWSISRSMRFDGGTLADAIVATCGQRSTPVVAEPVALSERAIGDPQKSIQWAAFRKRLGRTDAPETFAEVCAAVAAFLGPPIRSIARQEAFDRSWTPPGPWS